MYRKLLSYRRIISKNVIGQISFQFLQKYHPSLTLLLEGLITKLQTIHFPNKTPQMSYTTSENNLTKNKGVHLCNTHLCLFMAWVKICTQCVLRTCSCSASQAANGKLRLRSFRAPRSGVSALISKRASLLSTKRKRKMYRVRVRVT